MNLFSKISLGCMIFSLAISASSCTMLEDDVDYCPKGLYVRFVYDYNIQRADMFKDHVGYVALSLFNEDGQKVAERAVSNLGSDNPLATYGYTMHFDQAELPAGRYRLQAVAMQRDWDDALASDGAKYRRNNAGVADELLITLDHSSDVIPGTQRHAVDDSAPLDTLWHTLKVMPREPQDGLDVPEMPHTAKPYSVYPLEDQYVTVTDNMATYATVSLIRDTKHLNVTLRQIDNPNVMSHTDYEVRIYDNNGVLAHDNATVASDSLQYTPYAMWTSDLSDEAPSVNGMSAAPAIINRTAHYDLMFNRLIYSAKENEGAHLEIINRKNGHRIAFLNLPAILADGRIAYDICNYSPQEYLDREYNYRLDFILRGDEWVYCDLVIDVLSWAKRYQNEVF